MTEEYWVAVLKEEDRLLSNSDRKYRYADEEIDGATYAQKMMELTSSAQNDND